MPEFLSPADLRHNRELIADPAAFAKDARASSWLYLCGEEFAAMEGWMSHDDVRAAVRESDRSGAASDEMLARAEADDASFMGAEPLKAWVVHGLAEPS